MMIRQFLVVFAVTLSLTAVQASADVINDHAKPLFKRYIDLAAAYDPALADTYADDARIENKRVYPDGRTRTLVFSAPQYKQLLRQIMPIAKARGDFSTYSDTKYVEEGTNVRITATRFSELKKYSSPVSILVGASKDGTWLIIEELSESRP
jgi:hypothetical protein